MKKGCRTIILALLMIALLAVAAGCAKQENSEQEYIDTAEYELERVDNSIYDDEGNIAAKWYFDKLVIKNSSEAAEKINADAEAKCNEFFSEAGEEYIKESVEKYFTPTDVSYSLFSTEDGEVTYNEAGIISVKNTSNWCMGGVGNRNFSGYTYDLNTGKLLELTDLLQGEEKDILATVKSLFWDAVVEHYEYKSLFNTALDGVENKQLCDYKFFVGEGGELFLIVDTYEVAAGAAGAYCFASGLFVGDKCAPVEDKQLSEEMLTTGSWKWENVGGSGLYAYVDFFGDGTGAYIGNGTDFWWKIRYTIEGNKLELVLSDPNPTTYNFYYDTVKGELISVGGYMSNETENAFIKWTQLDFDHAIVRLPLGKTLSQAITIEKQTSFENSYAVMLSGVTLNDGNELRLATIYEYYQEPTIMGNPTLEMAQFGDYYVGYYQTEYDAIESIGFASEEDKQLYSKAVGALQFLLFGNENFGSDCWIMAKN